MTLEDIYMLLSEKLINWFRELIRLLPNMLLAAIVLTIGLFLSRFVKKVALKLIRKVSGIETVNQLFSSFIYIAFIGITLFITLSILQLDKAVTSILAGAGILGLALAFAFQDIAANFISGIFLSFRRPLQVGDLVEVDNYYGRVQVINLRDTTIITMQGQLIVIPNKDVFQKPIKNYTASNRRRLDLEVGVSYGDELAKVKQLTIEAAEQVSVRDASRAIELFYTQFGDSSINFTLRIWLKDTEELTIHQGRSEAIMLIKETYDKHDITIPFPIRTLDFGIKGGEKLSEMALHIENGVKK